MTNQTPQCPEALYDPGTDTLFRCINGPGQHDWHKDQHGTQWRDPMADVDLSQVDDPFRDHLNRLFKRLDSPANKADGPACTHCKGNGADPEDPGDYDTAVHMHNPYTVGPCPQCNGTGRQTTT